MELPLFGSMERLAGMLPHPRPRELDEWFEPKWVGNDLLDRVRGTLELTYERWKLPSRQGERS